MTFAEKPFPKGIPDFPFRTQILEYLKEYGNEVKGLVEFNKEVVLIEKHENLWCLTIRDLSEASRKISIEYFDAVAVASGK
jgi:cation diffusion facilitator CzcD-associated flavoprotein CzcO